MMNTQGVSQSLQNPVSVYALRVFLSNAPSDAEVKLDLTTDPDNPMLAIHWESNS